MKAATLWVCHCLHPAVFHTRWLWGKGKFTFYKWDQMENSIAWCSIERALNHTHLLHAVRNMHANNERERVLTLGGGWGEVGNCDWQLNHNTWRVANMECGRVGQVTACSHLCCHLHDCQPRHHSADTTHRSSDTNISASHTARSHTQTKLTRYTQWNKQIKLMCSSYEWLFYCLN